MCVTSMRESLKRWRSAALKVSGFVNHVGRLSPIKGASTPTSVNGFNMSMTVLRCSKSIAWVEYFVVLCAKSANEPRLIIGAASVPAASAARRLMVCRRVTGFIGIDLSEFDCCRRARDKIDNRMSVDSASGAQMEIGHVLFMDVVGYSKLRTDEQRALQEQLSEIVRNTECFRAAESNGRLVRLPVGDGMALVFFNTPEAPLRCAIEIQRALKNHSQIQLRMGIHCGPVNQVRDVNDRINIAGAGINMAQRVMDCADAGHILISKRVAEDLAQSAEWQPHLHDLGECNVKHDVKIDIFNFYDGEVGNAQKPQKIATAVRAKPCRRKWWIAAAVLASALIALFVYQKRFAGLSGADKSIAVLPFVNMSADPQNAFFADGIQDDILTSLSKIKDLRVIS